MSSQYDPSFEQFMLDIFDFDAAGSNPSATHLDVTLNDLNTVDICDDNWNFGEHQPSQTNDPLETDTAACDFNLEEDDNSNSLQPNYSNEGTNLPDPFEFMSLAQQLGGATSSTQPIEVKFFF
jgi:hypothetical protein